MMCYGCDLVNGHKIEIQLVNPIFTNKTKTFGKLANEWLLKNSKLK